MSDKDRCVCETQAPHELVGNPRTPFAAIAASDLPDALGLRRNVVHKSSCD